MAIDFKEQSLSEFLKDRLTEIKSEHRDHLSAGNLKDFAEYKRFSGIIEGIALAERPFVLFPQWEQYMKATCHL